MYYLKEFNNYILTIIYIFCIFSIFSISIWEIIVINKYNKNEFIIATEYNAFNFIFISSIVNIVNSIYLLWILINRFNIKISLIIFLIINLCLLVWSILLYKSIDLYNNFNNIIIIQFGASLMICLLLIMILSTYIYNNNKAYLSEHININDYILL